MGSLPEIKSDWLITDHKEIL